MNEQDIKRVSLLRSHSRISLTFSERAQKFLTQPRSQGLSSYPNSIPWASEKRLWLGLVTCYCDNWEHQGGVLCNQAICRIELCWIQSIMLRPPLPSMFYSVLLAEILNSTYSNIYLNFMQVDLSQGNSLWSWRCCRLTGFIKSQSDFNCGSCAV